MLRLRAAGAQLKWPKLYLFLLQKSSILGSMDSESRKIAIFFTFLVGGAIGFYLAQFLV